MTRRHSSARNVVFLGKAAANSIAPVSSIVGGPMARFLDGCTRCDKCLQGCPHDAIVHAPDRLREAAGTPIIDPDQQPCMMCDDFPCIAACEPNVQQVDKLFEDLQQGAEILHVQVRTVSDDGLQDRVVTLNKAHELLRSGQAKAIQVRYTFDEAVLV